MSADQLRTEGDPPPPGETALPPLPSLTDLTKAYLTGKIPYEEYRACEIAVLAEQKRRSGARRLTSQP